jgi:hypothetical protein
LIAKNYGGVLMANPLGFHPMVADDLAVATDWYDSISIGLGNRFRQAVDSQLDAVELRPQSFAATEGVMRPARIRRFPYLIVFEMTDTSIEVLGVFHTASERKKWRRRQRTGTDAA